MGQPPSEVRRWSEEDLLGVVADTLLEAEQAERSRAEHQGVAGPKTQTQLFRVRPKKPSAKK
ncbi:hypothetical protein VZQ01_06845 [Myxococcus faecalis]|uniref:hypothetical protein n=1 Tax=Myxococcus faecalis TaxID=3115646 RepID=UPI003CF4BCE6